MTKISSGGIFENFSARGVFYRKFRILTGSREVGSFLALLSHN